MADTDVDMAYCSNCKRDIAAANFVMHEVHCRRNIALCKHCQEPVPHKEMEEHYQDVHAPVKCELCNSSLDKEDLHNHKETECPKRKVHCAYCELDMPQCQLEAHQASCGTRTELCTLCLKYIMHRDKNRHDATNCSFPAQKKPTNNTVSNPMRTDPPDHLNTFAVDELTRMINDTTLMINDTAIGIPRPNNLRQPAASGNASLNTLRMQNDIQGTTRKRTTTNPVKKDTKNSERERENNRPQNGATNSDVDHLIALGLQGDMNSSSNSDLHQIGNDTILPCEFCDELFPANDLVSHQVECGLREFSLPEMNRDVNMLPNNRHSPPIPQPHGQPHILDNLGYLAAQDRLRYADPETLHVNPGVDDDIMLPCEFCDQLFPDDMLIQHQAVCNSSHLSGAQDHAPSFQRDYGRNHNLTTTQNRDYHHRDYHHRDYHQPAIYYHSTNPKHRPFGARSNLPRNLPNLLPANEHRHQSDHIHRFAQGDNFNYPDGNRGKANHRGRSVANRHPRAGRTSRGRGASLDDSSSTLPGGSTNDYRNRQVQGRPETRQQGQGHMGVSGSHPRRNDKSRATGGFHNNDNPAEFRGIGNPVSFHRGRPRNRHNPRQRGNGGNSYQGPTL